MRVDLAAARAAVERAGAAGWACPPTEVAWGIHDVVNETMASAARVHVAERGRDPARLRAARHGRRGAGARLGRSRGSSASRRVICPPSAGVASALGLLVAPGPRRPRGDAWACASTAASPPTLEAAFRRLEDEARAVMADTGLKLETATVARPGRWPLPRPGLRPRRGAARRAVRATTRPRGARSRRPSRPPTARSSRSRRPTSPWSSSTSAWPCGRPSRAARWRCPARRRAAAGGAIKGSRPRVFPRGGGLRRDHGVRPLSPAPSARRSRAPRSWRRRARRSSSDRAPPRSSPRAATSSSTLPAPRRSAHEHAARRRHARGAVDAHHLDRGRGGQGHRPHVVLHLCPTRPTTSRACSPTRGATRSRRTPGASRRSSRRCPPPSATSSREMGEDGMAPGRRAHHQQSVDGHRAPERRLRASSRSSTTAGSSPSPPRPRTCPTSAGASAPSRRARCSRRASTSRSPKLVRAGRRRRHAGPAPARQRADTGPDPGRHLGAGERQRADGAPRPAQLLEDYRLDALADLADELFGALRARHARRPSARCPTARIATRSETDGVDEPLAFEVALTVAGDEIVADYAGTSPAQPRAINCVLAYTYAMTAYAVRCALLPDLPNNEGMYRPVRVERARGLPAQPALPRRGGEPLEHRPLRAHARLRRPAPGDPRARDGRRRARRSGPSPSPACARATRAVHQRALLQRRHGRDGGEGRRERAVVAQQHLVDAGGGGGAQQPALLPLQAPARRLGRGRPVSRRSRPGHPDGERVRDADRR